jgi:hypothetical protein
MITSVEKIYYLNDDDTKTNFFSNVYKVIFANGIISNVPLDPANTDYQAIQEWIAEGGVVIDNGGN